jgi:hypothetical protein
MRKILRPGLSGGLLLLWTGLACAAADPDASTRSSIAVFDPVNLHNQTPDGEFGDLLREAFARSERWRLIPKDTMTARFRDYKMEPSSACQEFQCSFDAGNVLASEYVMFGTVTPWGDMYAYTLNVTHVRSSQVVWSQVGEVLRKVIGDPSAAVEATLSGMVDALEPEDLDTRRGLRRGLLTVLDLSPAGGTPSRVMAERVATHLYASRNFDIMSRRELDELLSALDVNKGNIAPTDSGIFSLGARMDITHLVYSRLTGKGSAGKGGEEFQLQLALYDIASGKKVRDWPSQPTNDFRKILEFENKFFSSLFKLPEYDSERDRTSWRPAAAWSGVGLGLALSTVFGMLAWSAYQEADRDYESFQGARSRDAALASKERVEQNDRKALVYGGLVGLGLAGAGAMLFLAF